MVSLDHTNNDNNPTSSTTTPTVTTVTNTTTSTSTNGSGIPAPPAPPYTSTSVPPTGSLTKLVVVLLAINIGLSIMIIPAFLVGKTSNLLAENDVDKMITNQGKLLSANYLAQSNNAYLVENEKQFVPVLPTIHHSVADISRILHEMEPVIAKLGLVLSNNTHGLSLSKTPLITK